MSVDLCGSKQRVCKVAFRQDWNVCVFVCVFVFLCVCVCVRERERERERACVCVCEGGMCMFECVSLCVSPCFS